MTRRLVALLVIIGATLLGGCTSSPSSTSGTQSTGVSAGAARPSGVPGASASATPNGSSAESAPSGPAVALGDGDKGRTVSVALGQQVTVTLSGGTDWRFTDPKPASVLTPMSAPVVDQANRTVSISFRAAKPGTAVATATRGSESYQIMIIVQ